MTMIAILAAVAVTGAVTTVIMMLAVRSLIRRLDAWAEVTVFSMFGRQQVEEVLRRSTQVTRGDGQDA